MLYSIFEHRPEGWVRLSPMALPGKAALRHWQNALLAYSLGCAEHPRRLMVVSISEEE